jgi:hypothetical protein
MPLFRSDTKIKLRTNYLGADIERHNQSAPALGFNNAGNYNPIINKQYKIAGRRY